MKLNEFTYIYGQKVILVPYKKEHVERYHEWMKCPELQQTTASEPLSLEQEYEMQQTWLNSDDKLTFIILDRQRFEEGNQNEIAAMIGDTNIFFNNNDHGLMVGEAEIMVAEKWARGQRRGWEAMLLMMQYACSNSTVRFFEAKIGLSNEASIKMFQKIGFQKTSMSEIFQEVTFTKEVDLDFKNWLSKETQARTEIKSQ